MSCGKCETIADDKIEDVSMMLSRTAKFGAIQSAAGNRQEITVNTVKSMLDYMEKSDDYLSLPSKIRNNCKNNNELCSFWAAIGECENNIAFMKIQCAPACQTCHLIDMENRCPKLPDAIPALKPGDLNSMFQRIVETAPGNRTLTEEDRRQLAMSEMPEYSVTVHSRPSDHPVTEVNIGLDRNLLPWVITFDNVLTDEECDAMIQHGFDTGYKRSEDVGSQKFDGTVESKKSKGRTSENAWCSTRNGCREKTVPKRILNRLSTIMGIPSENSEDFQILKYDVGQFYNTHHDYIPHQKDRQCGPRILTFFLYLSDVEAGGGTDFPDLGITVMPKKGRAVLWPSVYNSEPMNSDERFMHQALPVNAGLKFGANAWVHMFDYQAPQVIGCN
jgi:prolyl 4-hydroxylase